LVKGKSFSCVLWADVTCRYRKSETVTMMVRCWHCQEFKRFLREMDEDDAKMMNDIEKERDLRG
jgi:RNase P subunit RPR2